MKGVAKQLQMSPGVSTPLEAFLQRGQIILLRGYFALYADKGEAGNPCKEPSDPSK